VKIVGVLIWADESPGWLATAITGFARFCDHIVAVDGFYALYPGGKVRSLPDQAEAVLGACEAAGAACTLHRPNEVFHGNEVEKRNLSLQLAAPFLEPGQDWVCVFDADNHVYRASPEIIRWELENTDRNVASYSVLQGLDQLSGSELQFVRDLATEWTTPTRGIYRWAEDLRYGPAHYAVRGTYNGRSQWLWGPDKLGIETECLNLGSSLVVHHRRDARGLERRNAAERYYKVRDTVGVESFPDEVADSTWKTLAAAADPSTTGLRT
jgi:hypothetical protein